MDTILSILLAFFCIGFGLFSFFLPEDAIFLESRWKYDRAEPSDKYIRLTRIEGVLAALAGVVLLVLFLFLPST